VVNLSGGSASGSRWTRAPQSPKILLLDEPTTGLDRTPARRIWAILLGLKKEAETSLILTTHYMEEAEQLCDHIVIIDKGKILRERNARELLGTTAPRRPRRVSRRGERRSTIFSRSLRAGTSMSRLIRKEQLRELTLAYAREITANGGCSSGGSGFPILMSLGWESRSRRRRTSSARSR